MLCIINMQHPPSFPGSVLILQYKISSKASYAELTRVEFDEERLHQGRGIGDVLGMQTPYNFHYIAHIDCINTRMNKVYYEYATLQGKSSVFDRFLRPL